MHGDLSSSKLDEPCLYGQCFMYWGFVLLGQVWAYFVQMKL